MPSHEGCRLPLNKRAPPSITGWPKFNGDDHPFAPAPLQSLHHYYEAVRPSPAHRYFRPRGVSRLRLFPCHRRPGSHVPYNSLVELRATYMPDAARATFRTAPELIPGEGSALGFDIV